MRRQSQEFIRSLKSDLLQESHVTNVKNTMPQLVQQAESSSFTSTSTKPRSSTFSLALPWKPSPNMSNYVVSSQIPVNHPTSSNSQLKLSKSLRRFVASFPELADLLNTPQECCLSCLATPPHTPPDALRPAYPSDPSGSPPDTLSAISSAERINSTSMDEVCRGHLNDYICALERDNLYQGRLYVTVAHLCFYGEHSGKVVRIIIDYNDIVSVEREVGPFSYSIRIRAKPLLHTVVASQNGAMSHEDLLARKDYVLTSFVNYEQAVMEIEKKWISVRQDGTSQLIEPESFMAESMRLGRSRQECTRERRRLTRAQSLAERGVYSTSSIVSMLEAGAHSLSSRHSDITCTVDDEKFIYSLGRTTSQFGGSMSASSLDLPVTYEFQNQRCFKSNWRPSECRSASSPDHTFERAGAEPPMTLSNNAGDYDVSFNQTLAAPIPIQVSSSSSPRGYKFKSPTPPPSLLSPPLTTTKVSKSSSTVHGAAGKGTSAGMIVHVRTGSESADFDENTGNRIDNPGKLASQNHFTSELPPKLPHPSSQNGPRTSLSLTRPEATQGPSAPVLCGCERHYQNAILSTVVPIPLDLCFELLFSGQGAGQDDTLTCEAHRRVNGSLDVGISPWTADSLDDNVAGLSGWGKRKRQLEYSVIFKVPMLTKTSTACFETQEILQHSASVIRVQSESRFPNVPYGEQFSTLDQICMTWDSPGNTRIKCFTEVKFKRSIMLSSKVEAASLEVFGGFYRELIRQLVDVAETQSSMVIRPVLPALTSEALIRSPSISSDSATYSKMDDFISSDLDAMTPTSPSIYSRPSGVSAAQSLLSQQYLKSPPTISNRPRFSTSSTFTPAEFALPGRTSRKIIGLALKGRRSTATDVLKSIDLLTPSSTETPVLRDQDSIENNGTVTDSTTTKSVTKAIDLWSEFMSKGRAIFNKTNAYESHSKPVTSEASTECAAACNDAEMDPSTLEGEPSVLREPINIPKDKEGPTGISEVERMASDNMGSRMLGKPRTRPGLIPHIVIWTFAIGLIISILNAWRLVNTMSSVAHIMQTRNSQVDDVAESLLHNAFGSSVISRHLEKQANLIPIQIQTEMLRAEIMELKELLEAQKKLHQLNSRSRITEIP